MGGNKLLKSHQSREENMREGRGNEERQQPLISSEDQS